MSACGRVVSLRSGQEGAAARDCDLIAGRRAATTRHVTHSSGPSSPIAKPAKNRRMPLLIYLTRNALLFGVPIGVEEVGRSHTFGQFVSSEPSTSVRRRTGACAAVQ